MYLNKRWSQIGLILILIISLVMMSSCQQTPEKAPVVNKAEGLTDEMVAEPLNEGETKTVDAPSRWSDSLFRQDNRIEVRGDADVLIPDGLANTPIEKLEQKNLSNDQLTNLTEYFSNGSKLYNRLPMTKEEGNIQLEKINNGDGYYGRYQLADRMTMASALEEIITSAPESVRKEYTQAEFTLPYRSEYTQMMEKSNMSNSANIPQSKDFVSLNVETGGKYDSQIEASKFDSAAGTISTFRYEPSGEVKSEYDIRQNEIDLEITDSIHNFSDTKQKWFDEQTDFVEKTKSIIDSYDESYDEALHMAEQVLEDLGIISSFGLAKSEKGVWLPRQNMEWDKMAVDFEDAQGGYYFTFSRKNGQLLGFQQQMLMTSQNEQPEQQYIQPFPMETINIFVSDGEVKLFDWIGMANEIGTVAENTNLIPFGEITERLADHLSFVRPIPTGSGGAPDTYKERFEVEKAELWTDYIPAKDEPDKVWMVPVWVFSVRIYDIDDGVDKPRDLVDIEINALDGGVILGQEIVI